MRESRAGEDPDGIEVPPEEPAPGAVGDDRIDVPTNPRESGDQRAVGIDRAGVSGVRPHVVELTSEVEDPVRDDGSPDRT